MRLCQQNSCNIVGAGAGRMTGLDEGVPLAWCQLRQGRALHMEWHQLHTCNGESMAINMSILVEMAKNVVLQRM